MLATIINSVAIILGSLGGLLFRKHINREFRDTVFVAAGLLSLVIGIMMALKTEHVLYLALSLVGGGIIGAALHIEDAVLRFGELLRRIGSRFSRAAPQTAAASNSEGPQAPQIEESTSFAQGFLEASVLFCVGSMAILGSIQAGTSGDFRLLLTKSVMDGFIAILLAAGLGAGVAASALSVLVYQGLITLLAGFLQPFISPTILAMISSVGGPMVMMIGINLLGLRKIPTANFLPALALAIGFGLANPLIPVFFQG
jgi:uncharacterized membrane protein YqgA involved in biofilm formation